MSSGVNSRNTNDRRDGPRGKELNKSMKQRSGKYFKSEFTGEGSFEGEWWYKL